MKTNIELQKRTNYFKHINVRHPLRRLYSAWNQKFHVEEFGLNHGIGKSSHLYNERSRNKVMFITEFLILHFGNL